MPNRYIDLKKKDVPARAVSLTSFLSWFKLDGKCNLAAEVSTKSITTQLWENKKQTKNMIAQWIR